jgi:sialate O-acetylesterase
MEFAMYKLADKYPDDMANSANNNIREFHVEQQYSFTVKDDVKGSWKRANPSTIGRFTAVGYFMVKALYDKYKIPQGIIHTSWGGTPAEAWTSEEGLKDFANYLEKLQYFKNPDNVTATIEKDKSVQNNWYTKVNNNDNGHLNDGTTWASAGYNFSDWKSIKVPGFWEYQGEANVDGVVWYKKTITLSSNDLTGEALLDLGMLDDSDSTFFNGVYVGTTNNKYLQRKYKVPASLLKEGSNVITVRIIDTDGNGGFIKDKAHRLVTPGKTIDLDGDWQYKVGVSVSAMPVNTFTRLYYQPASLFNAMLAPLIPYTIKGAAWYQGESNSGKATEYRKLLPAMIDDWRSRWQQGDFPFLVVQLANYMAVSPQPAESGWAELREAQALTVKNVPNTALAVTIDIGETNDVHPLNKKEVGKRLALAAEKIAYNEKNIVYSGPVYTSMKVERNKIILSFDHIGGGLITNDGKPLSQFAIAGADKKFVWADAKIEGNAVVVSGPSVPSPVAVRYAWANNPEGRNLYNKEGLPASPFRTDMP